MPQGPSGKSPDDAATRDDQIEALQAQVDRLTRVLERSGGDIAIGKVVSPEALLASSQQRFPRRVIAERIRTVIVEKNISFKEYASLLGLSLSSIYKKFDEEIPFSIEETDRTARMLGAPHGWPYVSWELGLAIEHQLLGKPNG